MRRGYDAKPSRDRRSGRNVPPEKLSRQERRDLVIAALSGVRKTELARRYGIARGHVYRIIDEALADPESKLREAEEELAFRQRVLDFTGAGSQGW